MARARLEPDSGNSLAAAAAVAYRALDKPATELSDAYQAAAADAGVHWRRRMFALAALLLLARLADPNGDFGEVQSIGGQHPRLARLRRGRRQNTVGVDFHADR